MPAAGGLLLGGAVGQLAALVGELERFFRFLGMAFLKLFGGDLELLGAKQRREHVAADAQIAALAVAAVGMEDDAGAERRVGRGADRALVGRRAEHAERIDVDSLRRAPSAGSGGR